MKSFSFCLPSDLYLFMSTIPAFLSWFSAKDRISRIGVATGDIEERSFASRLEMSHACLDHMICRRGTQNASSIVTLENDTGSKGRYAIGALLLLSLYLQRLPSAINNFCARDQRINRGHCHFPILQISY
jgi:hypothetical protein